MENIPVRWSKASGFHAENLHLNEIESLEDLMDTLEVGMKNRAVAAHSMNDHSSRSHSVLTVHLDSEMVSIAISRNVPLKCLAIIFPLFDFLDKYFGITSDKARKNFIRRSCGK